MFFKDDSGQVGELQVLLGFGILVLVAICAIIYALFYCGVFAYLMQFKTFIILIIIGFIISFALYLIFNKWG